MKSNFSLLFYIREKKNYKGDAMRITVDGKHADLSTGREPNLPKGIARPGVPSAAGKIL